MGFRVERGRLWSAASCLIILPKRAPLSPFSPPFLDGSSASLSLHLYTHLLGTTNCQSAVQNSCQMEKGRPICDQWDLNMCCCITAQNPFYLYWTEGSQDLNNDVHLALVADEIREEFSFSLDWARYHLCPQYMRDVLKLFRLAADFQTWKRTSSQSTADLLRLLLEMYLDLNFYKICLVE